MRVYLWGNPQDWRFVIFPNKIGNCFGSTSASIENKAPFDNLDSPLHLQIGQRKTISKQHELQIATWLWKQVVGSN